MELERDPAKYDLKPCPFCGAPPELEFDEAPVGGGAWEEHAYIACSLGCLDEDQHYNSPGAPQTPLMRSIAEVAALWNRMASQRQSEPPHQPAVSAAETSRTPDSRR